MSLKAFHVLFITIASALSAGFGVWCMTRPTELVFSGVRPLGVASFVVAGTLLVYGFWFLRKIRAWEDDEAKSHSPLPFPGGDHDDRDAR